MLAVLLLRGPQTPGELKQRTERMAPLSTLADVEVVLAELDERGYARRLARRPGQKEDRFEQLLGGSHAEPVSGGPVDSRAEPVLGGPIDSRAEPVLGGPIDSRAEPVSGGPVDSRTEPVPGGPGPPADPIEPPIAGDGLEERVAALEAEVERLRAELSDLRRAQVGSASPMM